MLEVAAVVIAWKKCHRNRSSQLPRIKASCFVEASFQPLKGVKCTPKSCKSNKRIKITLTSIHFNESNVVGQRQTRMPVAICMYVNAFREPSCHKCGSTSACVGLSLCFYNSLSLDQGPSSGVCATSASVKFFQAARSCAQRRRRYRSGAR